MFKYGPLAYTHFTEMHDHCPTCGQSFNPEPGFYQIAMYASYAFTIAILIASFIAVYLIGHNPGIGAFVSITTGITVLLAQLNHRYSRVTMLYLFGGIKYDATAAPEAHP